MTRLNTESQIGTPREVTKIVRGQRSSDGAGVRLSRVIGGSALPDLDPFLLFDEFRSDEAADYIGGFPDHPHRGFETVTYMLAGRMRHGDNKGNVGLLLPGSVQWMTAGRGIVHSEMPEQENGLMWGFQLWVNLPASDKMTAPRYQDIPPSDIPEVALESGRVRVIAGRFGSATGPVSGVATDPVYLDVTLNAGTTLAVPLPRGHHAFAFVYEGEAALGDERIGRGELAVLAGGDGVELVAGDAGARVLVVAGRPLDEPIAKYGPFVMNTVEELQQAFADYQSGRF
jgi:quercetin 2,3-dioxygenase